MPLINLRTDLKSLRYGKDVPGGGYSGQPFIQVSKRNSFDLPVSQLGQSGAGTDFLLRGGTLSITNSAKDVSRIFQLFTQTSTGITFTGKQNVLALTGQNYSAGGPPLAFRGNRRTGFNSEGVYLPTSTLLQVGVNAFGLHGNKQGVNPFPIDVNLFGFNLNIGGRPTYLGYMSTAAEKFNNKLVYLSETAPSNTTGQNSFYPVFRVQTISTGAIQAATLTLNTASNFNQFAFGSMNASLSNLVRLDF